MGIAFLCRTTPVQIRDIGSLDSVVLAGLTNRLAGREARTCQPPFGPFRMGPPHSLKPAAPASRFSVAPTKEARGNVNQFTFGHRITWLNLLAGGFQGPGR